jgi:thiol:disulfide interchange protein DsbC
MFKRFAVCLLALAGVLSVASRADENTVRQSFQTKFPKMTLESVSRTPFANIYEVVLDGQVFYTDDNGTYLLSGNLLDLRGREPRNLTQESNAKHASTVLAKSTDSAVKRVRGNGKRVIYTFLWAILSQDSVDKAKAIWCSKDRARAWEDVMLKGVTPAPAAKRDCDAPLEKNGQLAQRFGLRGTPAVYLANGQQIGGYVAADKIEAALAAK